MLADLGADVVKVEEPGRGDYIRWTPPLVGEFSAAHIALNRNKRSITIDLRSDGGRALMLRLAEHFDIVIESFRPGVMDRLGVGYTALREVHPGLIYCAITGYGQDGPRSQTAGHDVNYIGYAGLLSIIGPEDGPPVIPGVQIGDLAGGGMNAVIAVLAALHRRSTTGSGEFCDISMMDGALSWLSIHAGEFVATGEDPSWSRTHLSGKYPCYRIYPAADGYLTVGALEPQFWTALCAALGRNDLIDDAFAMGERRDEVVADLSALFATRSRAEWMEALTGLDVCVGPVNDLSEAFADDQVTHRDMVVDRDVPGAGAWRHLGNPIRMQEAPGSIDRLPPPRMGEHTDQVLSECGLNAEEVETLRQAGAI